MRARMVDVSRHQGVVDGAKLKAAGFIAMIARCTIGWSYYDPFYEANMEQALNNDLIFGAYHVLWPANANPIKEAEWFHRKAIIKDGPLFGSGPAFVVADIELKHNKSGAEILAQSKILLENQESLFGMTPVVYTGSWFWDTLGPPQSWVSNYPLWEAEYLYKVGLWDPGQSPEPPKEPGKLADGWADWAIWQWTSKGKPIGVQSSSLDYNVFNGTEEDFRQFVGASPSPPTLEEKVDILWDAHPDLHPEE